MDAANIENELTKVILTNDELQNRLAQIAAEIDRDYADAEHPLLLVGVLKGAVMVMADLARAISIPVHIDFMAVSSYGSGTKSSGVVRILKDLDIDRRLARPERGDIESSAWTSHSASDRPWPAGS